jgi:hypothetical protein
MRQMVGPQCTQSLHDTDRIVLENSVQQRGRVDTPDRTESRGDEDGSLSAHGGSQMNKRADKSSTDCPSDVRGSGVRG